jgi:hypothetical protein
MKYFSVLDLKNGFFQVPIAPEDKEKTTFFTGSKLCNSNLCLRVLKTAQLFSKEE